MFVSVIDLSKGFGVLLSERIVPDEGTADEEESDEAGVKEDVD